jgi:hypothetical protein
VHGVLVMQLGRAAMGLLGPGVRLHLALAQPAGGLGLRFLRLTSGLGGPAGRGSGALARIRGALLRAA